MAAKRMVARCSLHGVGKLWGMRTSPTGWYTLTVSVVSHLLSCWHASVRLGAIRDGYEVVKLLLSSFVKNERSERGKAYTYVHTLPAPPPYFQGRLWSRPLACIVRAPGLTFAGHPFFFF